MVQISGKYEHQKCENVDAYLAVIGVPWLVRKTAANINPSLEIENDGDKWTITFKTAVMNNTTSFTIGEEFEEKHRNGKTTKAKATFDKNTLVITTFPDIGEVRRELTFTETGIDMTMVAVSQKVEAKRIFKRI